MQSALLFGCGNHQRHFKWVYKIGFKNGAAFWGGLKRAARNASANGGATRLDAAEKFSDERATRLLKPPRRETRRPH